MRAERYPAYDIMAAVPSKRAKSKPMRIFLYIWQKIRNPKYEIRASDFAVLNEIRDHILPDPHYFIKVVCYSSTENLVL